MLVRLADPLLNMRHETARIAARAAFANAIVVHAARTSKRAMAVCDEAAPAGGRRNVGLECAAGWAPFRNTAARNGNRRPCTVFWKITS